MQTLGCKGHLPTTGCQNFNAKTRDFLSLLGFSKKYLIFFYFMDFS